MHALPAPSLVHFYDTRLRAILCHRSESPREDGGRPSGDKHELEAEAHGGGLHLGSHLLPQIRWPARVYRRDDA